MEESEGKNSTYCFGDSEREDGTVRKQHDKELQDLLCKRFPRLHLKFKITTGLNFVVTCCINASIIYWRPK